MSMMEPLIFVTDHDDGSADFTISVDDEDHKFSVSVADDGDHGAIAYDETRSWRGQIRVSEPREEVWRLLMQSNEMTEYLEANGLSGVSRDHSHH